MDDIPFLSPTPPPVSHPTLSSISKPTHSPSATLLANSRQRTDSASVIQQADVSSSRPALLAHDALGPLLFEVGKAFFFLAMLIDIYSTIVRLRQRQAERQWAFFCFSSRMCVERIAMTTRHDCSSRCARTRDIMQAGTKRKKGVSQSFDGLGVAFFLFFSLLLMRVRFLLNVVGMSSSSARALLLQLLTKCFVKTEHFYHVSFSFLLSMKKAISLCQWLRVPTSRKTLIWLRSAMHR